MLAFGEPSSDDNGIIRLNTEYSRIKSTSVKMTIHHISLKRLPTKERKGNSGLSV
jgi:hypothetical protein